METRWKPSVTVAAIVASQIDGQTRYLLVEEDTPEGLMLNNPAGHLDPAESPVQGVVREALEETARDFAPEYLVGLYMSRFQRMARDGSEPRVVDDVTYLRFAYAGSVGEPDPQRALDVGIVRTLWMSLDEVRASRSRHRSALVLRCIEDHAAGRRYPLDLLNVDASIHSPEIKAPS
ncbi:NUDIX hydrolase [Piscinibacter sakaiensis]|uniref:NUDIX hydrolase n=1 Tax=Piscinibacter sakaiensis TaxID=1547922 RepID=UPI003AAE7253